MDWGAIAIIPGKGLISVTFVSTVVEPSNVLKVIGTAPLYVSPGLTVSLLSFTSTLASPCILALYVNPSPSTSFADNIRFKCFLFSAGLGFIDVNTGASLIGVTSNLNFNSSLDDPSETLTVINISPLKLASGTTSN